MSNDAIPLPEPDWIFEVRQWLQNRDNAHAAAVSAYDNATLREAVKHYEAELLREHADHKETVEDAATVVHQNTALRERVRVLEDVLRSDEQYLVDLCTVFGSAFPNGRSARQLTAIRAALGDKT